MKVVRLSSLRIDCLYLRK